MLAVDASGCDAFADWLEKQAVEAVLMPVLQAYRSFALEVLTSIVELTPQWTGNLAANWVLELNGETASERNLGDPRVLRPTHGRAFSPYSRGMDPAVSKALAQAQAAPIPGLSDAFYIHNPVSYAQEVEDDSGTPRIRPINRFPRGEVGKVAMVAFAYTRYGTVRYDL